MTEAGATPHVFPFRLVERLETKGERRVALVLATGNGFLCRTDPWPVSIVAEALAQAILFVDPPPQMSSLRLAALQSVALYQQVRPGDRLEVEVEAVGSLGSMRRYRCRATRGGALAALADLTVTS